MILRGLASSRFGNVAVSTPCSLAAETLSGLHFRGDGNRATQRKRLLGLARHRRRLTRGDEGKRAVGEFDANVGALHAGQISAEVDIVLVLEQIDREAMVGRRSNITKRGFKQTVDFGLKA